MNGPAGRRTWLVIAGILGFVGVAAGAFAAHALADLPERYLNALEVGARYGMYHALALFGLAFLPATRTTRVAGASWVAGTVIFSGSLYALALTRAGWVGAITPIGGVLLLVGWGALAVHGLRRATTR